MYNCTLSITSALVEVGGQHHALAAFLPGKTQYPLYRRLGESQAGLYGYRKSRPLLCFDPLTVQLVPSRYTDWAIPAHHIPVRNVIITDVSMLPISVALWPKV
jgi:hypothetical protein